MAADAGARAGGSLAAAGGGELAAAAAAASTASAGASATFAALRRIGRIRSRDHTGAHSGLLTTSAGGARCGLAYAQAREVCAVAPPTVVRAVGFLLAGVTAAGGGALGVVLGIITTLEYKMNGE